MFDRKTFADAVVMPSYRNIDQPQYFYVAEIRDDLNLRSAFPSPELYDTFEHYYSSKYSLEITNLEQPLLDVDHTSARLNLLTPRYMNQKGVALPTSSAETRRAKRENLQQKQILVPELCIIHPFPASLWRKAVCIPTILYRMNYLLIAEELRVQIATEAHLGLMQPTEEFQFPSLRFGFTDNGCHVVDPFMSSDENNCQGGCGLRCTERLEGMNGVVKVSCKDVITSVDEHLNKVNGFSRSADVPSSVGRRCSHNQCRCRNCAARAIFSFDAGSAYGPSPCDIIQTLTMSNANDFFNLERLETIGDSFLKFAITVYLYCTYPGIHEGKLSYLRSIQVSNYNLYKLGKKKGLPECMVAVKFEPVENWLPPGFVIKSDAIHSDLTVPISVSQNDTDSMDEDAKAKLASRGDGGSSDSNKELIRQTSEQQRLFTQELEECTEPDEDLCPSSNKILIPYNLQTQHSLPDKSVADCVEALIGCYLVTCGQRAALLFMAWLGLRVLPSNEKLQTPSSSEVGDVPHSNGHKNLEGFGTLQLPPSPLLLHVPKAKAILEHYLDGFNEFETVIQYKFRDRSYLLQAFTHASYHYNTVTDCYQRFVIAVA